MNVISNPHPGSGVPSDIATDPDEASSDAILLNVEQAIERMGDKEIYLEIARFFATNLPNSLKALQEALEQQNMEDATRYAHSLKGNCATVGADALREDCLKLERSCREGDIDTARKLYRGIAPKLLFLRDRLLAL